MQTGTKRENIIPPLHRGIQNTPEDLFHFYSHMQTSSRTPTGSFQQEGCVFHFINQTECKPASSLILRLSSGMKGCFGTVGVPQSPLPAAPRAKANVCVQRHFTCKTLAVALCFCFGFFFEEKKKNSV